jgi:long-chain acyl-CoA synthetase
MHPFMLQGFEQVRNIHVDSEPFSVENGLTTPTFKHKRSQLLQHYKSEIDR